MRLESLALQEISDRLGVTTTGVIGHLMTHHRLETGQDVDPALVLNLQDLEMDVLEADAVLDYDPDA